MKQVIRGAAIIVAVVAVTGCAGGSKPPPEVTLPTEVVASAELNPNRRGTAQPVKLHVFYLKQDEAFVQANFNDLAMPDAPIIAGDLIRRTESLVGPGEVIRLDEKFDEQTRFIGVVAEFTRIEQAGWRALIPIPKERLRDKLNPFKDRFLRITLDSLSVSGEIIEE